MLTQVQIENEQDQVPTFQYIYFESFPIHQKVKKVIKYHFEHIDHDFEVFPYFFCMLMINILMSSIYRLL